ncbi:thermonuclease family protein [Arthrobacter sp. zg-Y916]|uniref:thermonuclease family protein n=1 Tax=Arthrobacter sp. zg-Y916 TaxID=2894190 RepID=UPI002F3E3435|nr:thermonuclease family protein [Arthrobacter sp. zg-Y916]
MILTKKAVIAAVAAVAVTATSVVFANAANADKARVVRIIDGDTLVVDFQNEDITVRLLNVDTPETKDPNKPVECLGPEATDFLADVLPAGSKVTLAFDVERHDRYGRTLAAVYDSKDRLINAEVARQGFGIPVTYGKNSKFRPPVDAAYKQAEERQAGLFAEDIECTVPGTVAALEDAAQEAAAEDAGSSAASAATAAAAVLASQAVVRKTLGELEAGAKTGSSLIWKTVSEADRAAFLTRAKKATESVEKRHTELSGVQAERQAAEDEAKRLEAEAKAEAERVAAEEEARKVAEAEQAEANRLAAEAAEVERQRAAAAAQAEAQRQQQQQYVAPPPQPQPPIYVDPAPVQSNPDGYTGPRCYAPGGKTWKPCP